MGARVGGTYATTAARKTFASAESRDALDRAREFRTAEQVAEELGQMKGALMKLGQMASYLDDGLPEPLRLALAQLQSDRSSDVGHSARSTVESELGGPIDELFIEYDDEPIAAASIGQVHRAIVRENDGAERAVAVKVQYPGVGEASRPICAMPTCSARSSNKASAGSTQQRWSTRLKFAWPTKSTTNSRPRTRSCSPTTTGITRFIRIPAVIDSHSTKRVLTTELATGYRWSEMLDRGQETRDRVGEIIFRFVFRSLYRFGAFNGDPHPGNYLFHEDGTVTFLDFGLVNALHP